MKLDETTRQPPEEDEEDDDDDDDQGSLCYSALRLTDTQVYWFNGWCWWHKSPSVSLVTRTCP